MKKRKIVSVTPLGKAFLAEAKKYHKGPSKRFMIDARKLSAFITVLGVYPRHGPEGTRDWSSVVCTSCGRTAKKKIRHKPDCEWVKFWKARELLVAALARKSK